MALAITRDKGYIKNKGGGFIKVKQVTEAGADLTVTASVVDLGYIQESTFTDNTPLEDIKDETGNTVVQEEGDREVMISATLMQTGSDVLDIPKQVRGNFYQLYKYNGIKDGKHQEMFFAVGQITPQASVTWIGGRMPFEYKSSIVASTVTISVAQLTALGAYATQTVNIAANDYYTVVETPVS